MATVETTAYAVVALEDIEHGEPNQGRVRLDVRRKLGITAFGINAFRAVGEGQVIRDHDEAGLGPSQQEELYVVLGGAATFEIDGNRVEAPAGSLIFVGDPAAKRSAVAQEDGTTILVVGGTAGKAYEPTPQELVDAMAAYNAGDYATAVEKQLLALERRPDDPLAVFNAACYEARLGRTDDAIEHLRLAAERDGRVIEHARTDEDLDPIREDPRFAAIVG